MKLTYTLHISKIRQRSSVFSFVCSASIFIILLYIITFLSSFLFSSQLIWKWELPFTLKWPCHQNFIIHTFIVRRSFVVFFPPTRLRWAPRTRQWGTAHLIAYCARSHGKCYREVLKFIQGTGLSLRVCVQWSLYAFLLFYKEILTDRNSTLSFFFSYWQVGSLLTSLVRSRREKNGRYFCLKKAFNVMFIERRPLKGQQWSEIFVFFSRRIFSQWHIARLARLTNHHAGRFFFYFWPQSLRYPKKKSHRRSPE